MGKSEIREATSEQDARTLLEKIARRDRASFETFYFLYSPRIARYAGTLLKHDDWIDELVNDVMMVVWQNAEKFRPTSRVTTWLFGIAHNKALKILEKHYRRREDSLEMADCGDDDTETFDIPDETTPETVLSSHHDAAVVKRALDQLTPEHRAVMELTFYEDHSYPEIAEIIGCPVNTVKTRMFHARKRLQALLTEYSGGGYIHA